MRRPRMSTGAWIFTTAVTVAVIAPTAVYAAATSMVAIGDTTSTRTVSVTTQHQLLTTPIAPRQVVHFGGGAVTSCTTVYTPPAGKAVVVTSLTYEIGSGTAGDNAYGYLTDPGCTNNYDVIDTNEAYETQQRTFPTGLPLSGVAIYRITSSYFVIYGTGYLIPASQLPATAAPAHGPMPAHP